MKKVLFVILLLLFIPSESNAWESSIGTGYQGRIFRPKDDLGSTNEFNIIHPKFSNQLALDGSFLFGANSFFKTGLSLSFAYGKFYIQENVNNLQIWSSTIALDLQHTNKNLNFHLKPGFIINGVTSGYTEKIDIDAGVFSFGVRISINLFGSQRFFIEPQMLLTPQIGMKVATEPVIVIGIESIFKPNKIIEKVIDKPEIRVIEPPKEITPVVIPEPATPVSIPAPVTETEKPAVLKFSGDNLISPESLGFLEKVVKIHNSVLSVIKINFSKGENAKKKAEALYTWFIQYGVNKDEVQLAPGLKGKEIRIEVVPK